LTDQTTSELLQGTLELLVLKTLTLEPMHGWGIAQRIQQLSREVFQVNQGSLYPALQRMLRKGWIKSEWRMSDNNRRARYYTLTAEGRRQIAKERESWDRASMAVNWILNWAGGAP
jgi:PadR family transcriptional regulator, regulatory protein PadR